MPAGGRVRYSTEPVLLAVFRTEVTAREDQDHRIATLQLGELAAGACVIGKLVVGELGARLDIGSHNLWSTHRLRSPVPLRGPGMGYYHGA